MRIDARVVVIVLIVGAAVSGLGAIYVGITQGGGFGDDGTAGSAAEPDDDGVDDDGMEDLSVEEGDLTVEEECSDRTVCVVVRVVDGDGNPVGDRRVTLLDRGGTPDETTKRTNAEGIVRFEEGVGPPPCNTQYLVFPPDEDRIELGCHDGPETITRTVEVEG